MEDNHDKASKGDIVPDPKDKGERTVDPGDDPKMEGESSESVAEKRDSGRETGTEDSSRRTSSDTSGIEVGKESTTSPELPPITERPDESKGAVGGASSSIPSTPSKKSIFSRAKGMAVKGIQAVARTISPKKDSQESPKGSKSPGSKGAKPISPGSKGAKSISPKTKESKSPGIKGAMSVSPGSKGSETKSPGSKKAMSVSPGSKRSGSKSPGSKKAKSVSPGSKRPKSPGSKGATSLSPGSKGAKSSGSKSPKKVWSKWKQALTSGRKRPSEDDDTILTSEELQKASCDEDPTDREENASKKSNIMPGSGTEAPPLEEPMETAESSLSGPTTSSAAAITAQEKRSRFAGLTDLKKGKFGDYPIKKPVWTSERASLEESSPDATEELDIDTPREKAFPVTEDDDSRKENVDETEDAGTSDATIATDDEKQTMEVDDETSGAEEKDAKDSKDDDSPMSG